MTPPVSWSRCGETLASVDIEPVKTQAHGPGPASASSERGPSAGQKQPA